MKKVLNRLIDIQENILIKDKLNLSDSLINIGIITLISSGNSFRDIEILCPRELEIIKYNSIEISKKMELNKENILN